MCPVELIEDEIGIELYPHHCIGLPLVDVLDYHQEIITEND